MRVLCCYRELDEANALALVRFAPQVEFVAVDSPRLPPSLSVLINARPKQVFPEPVFGHLKISAPGFWYWNAICDRWLTDDLMIVEPNIKINAEVVASFKSCPEPWCIYTYDAGWGTNLGCERFRKELQEMLSLKHHVTVYRPESPDRELVTGPLHDPRHFTRIGSSFNYSALDQGFTPHVHGDLDRPDA